MITTVAELLQSLMQEEAAKLDKSGIKHAPTIGAMYEGLTRDVVERALPPALGLQIVDGFVVDGRGGRSGQIDGMLVRGEGVPVPYVPGSFEWHVKDVLAVFEIKKTLFGAGLEDAYGQMAGVVSQYSSWIQNVGGDGTLNLKAAFRAYAEITGEVAPPGSAWKTMPMDRHLILHTLMMDQLAPIRIIFGYGGYTTEHGLRKGFLDYLGENIGVLGFGPPTLPNLIVANGSSLVKLSGHPYRAPVDKDGSWPLVGSSSINPLHFVLELIWTRISYDYPIADLFGDDLEIEVFAPLLNARPTFLPDNPGRWGWMYNTFKRTKAQLEEGPATEAWEPTVLDAFQYAIVNSLCHDDLDINEPAFIEAVEGEGVSVEAFVLGLVETRLVARDGDRLTLITTECACLILPDGRYIAGENSTGRLTRWVDAFMAARREAAAGPK